MKITHVIKNSMFRPLLEFDEYSLLQLRHDINTCDRFGDV